MTYRIAQTAYKNISRNKRRSILSGAAIAVASMSIVMLFALIGGMSADMSNNLRDYYSGEIRIRNAEYEKYERFNPIHLTVDIDSAAEVLSDIPYITSWTARTTFPTSLYINGTNAGAIGVGVDFQHEAEYLDDLDSILKEGVMPSAGQNEMLIGAVLARDHHLKVGDKVTIMSMTASRGTNAITLKITGIAAFPVANMNSNFFWMPLDRTQHFLQMPGASQDILVKTDGSLRRKAASADIREAFAAADIGADVQAMEEISTMYSMMKLADAIYNVIAVFFFLLGSTVIINTTMMVIFERMREIGTLSALGDAWKRTYQAISAGRNLHKCSRSRNRNSDWNYHHALPGQNRN